MKKLLFFLSILWLLVWSIKAQNNRIIDSLRATLEPLSWPQRDSVLHAYLVKTGYDQEVESWLHRSLYNAHLMNGQADSALKHALKAYEIDLNLGDKIAQAADISNILAYYLDTDQPQRAIGYAEALTKLLPLEQYPYNKFVYLQNIGAIYQQVNSIEKALDFYRQAQKIAEDNGITTNLGWTYQNIAALYINNVRDTATSRTLYKKVIEITDSATEPDLLVYGYIGMALCNNHPKDSLANAIFWLQRAEAITIRLNVPRLKAEVDELLSNYYYKLGKNKEAYDYLRKYTDLKIELQRNEKAEIMAEIENQFENRLKNSELELTQQKARQANQWKNFYFILSILLIGFATGVILLLKQRSQIAVQNQKLTTQRIERLMQDQQIAVYDAQLEGEERERLRVAHELHDRVGGLLSSMKMCFEGIKTNLTAENLENVDRLFSASQMLDEAYGEVRRISHNLGGDAIDQAGLFHSIQNLAKTIEKNTGTQVELNIYLLENNLKKEVQTQIYRILQELVTNTLKYAKASKISLSVTQHHDELYLIYEDNGVGFKRDSLTSSGIGMRSIASRVQKLKGVLEINSAPKKGMSAVINVPLK